MAYGETTIRARIKAVLEGVTNIGKVYDYERWTDDWDSLIETFKTTINGREQIRGWVITLQRMTPEIIGFQGGGVSGTLLATYTYLVRGFLGVDDANETEKTMTALALAAAWALENDATLRSEVLEKEEPVVSELLQDYRMFGGVLCHYVEMKVQPQEVV